MTFEIEFTDEEATALSDHHGYMMIVNDPEDLDGTMANPETRVQFLARLGKARLSPFLAAAALKQVETTIEAQKQATLEAANKALSDRIVVTEA